MEIEELQGYYLVGGTALALKYGHRLSIDIDLFGQGNFDNHAIVSALSNSFGSEFEYEERPASWAIFCFIQDVKVDIVRYEHPQVAHTQEVDGIRMFSTEDISAMKINAILGRGTKKDFFDIYELLHHFSLDQMITFYQEKFPRQMLLISIPQALIYFADAEESEDPVCLKGQSWEEVKRLICKKVNEYLT
jgi:hypothetical protein